MVFIVKAALFALLLVCLGTSSSSSSSQFERNTITNVIVDSSADVAAQTHRICSDGLCFETASVGDQISNLKQRVLTRHFQLVMNNTDITLGFAMPKEDCGEFLVNASIPLPYGFLSFTMGGNDYNSDP